MQVVSEASAGDEAVEKALEVRPDVIVMDVRMPHMSGIQATRKIKQQLPDTGIVMISALDNDPEIFDSIEAGANGFLVKDDEPEALVAAVRNASEGRAYLPPSITKRLMERVANPMGAGRSGRAGHPGESPLTEREISVLRLLALGKRNREIATALGISERTVGNHIVNIYQKLRIKDRAQAIMYAVRNGIINV